MNPLNPTEAAKKLMRTDKHNNPTAFTTDIAKEAGLIEGVDYSQGDPFTIGKSTYYTAKLLGHPLILTIKVIDKIGFYNKAGQQRWIYIAMPKWIWDTKLSIENKISVIGFMYQHEGGMEMKGLFIS